MLHCNRKLKYFIHIFLKFLYLYCSVSNTEIIVLFFNWHRYSAYVVTDMKTKPILQSEKKSKTIGLSNLPHVFIHIGFVLIRFHITKHKNMFWFLKIGMRS